MKIAVIGGGFSGMLSAYLLEKEGVKVTVYEKEDHIGGHCQTILGKNEYTELGTTFSFSKYIKELLVELKVDYTERMIYRNFVDENFNSVEHIDRGDVAKLLDELSKLEKLLAGYGSIQDSVNYGCIPKDLLIPLSDFLKQHDLNTIRHIIAPHLSSFGFGDINKTQAYYAFKVFNYETINAFIRSEKLLFIKKGTTELINKLSERISDIRYSFEVTNIETVGDRVKVDTTYDSSMYDKVLITTTLKANVIKEPLYNQLMQMIKTTPYITCAYEIEDKNIVTTYFKSQLGQIGKIQFFHTKRSNSKTLLVAFAYGKITPELVNGITEDIKASGVHIKHMITAKQWHIFPHLEKNNLTETIYRDVVAKSRNSNIQPIGSLICPPSIADLYLSVKESIAAL